jgi:hypothetical protein
MPHMTRRRSPSLDAITPEQIDGRLDFPDDRRSDLYVWMSRHRAAFAAVLAKDGSTWSAVTRVLSDLGIRPNGAGEVKAETVRKTWYRVRRDHGEPIGDPVAKAEVWKITKRRKPRRPPARVREPPPGPGEVVAGVRLIEPPTPTLTVPAVAEAVVPPQAEDEPTTQVETALQRLRDMQPWMQRTKGRSNGETSE